MAIDFPSSPTLNQVFTSGGTSWQWNGSEWNLYDGSNLVTTAYLSTALGSYAPSSSPSISNPTITGTGSITAATGTFTQSITAPLGWSGTGTSSGSMGGIPMAFVCERGGTGTAGDSMAFGNGSGVIKGIRMPFAGKLIAATLHGTNITGTIAVDPYIDGSANSLFRLTANNPSAADMNVTEIWQGSPLSFTAGTLIGWYQATVPSSASGYRVTFFITFN